MTKRPLWTCPACKNAFTHRNASHSCGVWPLEGHFEGKPRARELFLAFLARIREIGPVTVVSSKTRIAIMTRMRFAAVQARKHHLRGHLVLRRRVGSPLFVRIDDIDGRCWVHHFELRDPAELEDREMTALLREAYSVGDQAEPG